MMSKATNRFPPKSVNGRCGWSSTPGVSTGRAGGRSCVGRSQDRLHTADPERGGQEGRGRRRQEGGRLQRDGRGGLRCRAMPGGTADEERGDSSHYPQKATQDDDPGQKGALSAGQGEPPVPRAAAQHAPGQRFHLCRHLERPAPGSLGPVAFRWLDPCCLRHRRLCPPHPGLAGQPFGPCGVRPRCPGKGGA